MAMQRTFLLFLVCASAAFAQIIGAGLKVGAPLTDALNVNPSNAISYVESTHRYVVGPYFELRLPERFSVEFDALYRSYEYQRFAGPSVSPSVWEFPLLAKKTLFGGPLQPYVEGGVSLAHVSVNDVIELNHRTNYGVVLGAGVSFHLGFVKIAPELRYNGWAFRNFDSPDGALQSNRNQASLLVGIGF
jgi:opacity protein-like surface antigen